MADPVSERDWRDDPLLPEQTEDDLDRETADRDAADPDDRDERLREDVPPHHGTY